MGSDYYAPNVPLLIVYFLQQISKVGYGAQIISFERKGAQCYSYPLWKDTVTEMPTNKNEKKIRVLIVENLWVKRPLFWPVC